MNLFGFLHKPDWEHKDAARRLRAVQSGREPALLERLPELAQADPDPGVRMAALRRVDDPHLLARRMRGELDSRVAAVARERLLASLCDATLALEARRAAMLDLPDAELLARVAERAPDASLRRAALEHITRPGFLFERCLKDPDAEVRLWLLGRIDAPDALQRLADSARKRDKALARAARERLDALLLSSGDAAALQRAALALCERAGRLGRELPPDRDQQLEALQAAWADLAARVDADLQRRTEGALAMAAAAIAGTRAPAPAEAASQGTTDADAGSPGHPSATVEPSEGAAVAVAGTGAADTFAATPPDSTPAGVADAVDAGPEQPPLESGAPPAPDAVAGAARAAAASERAQRHAAATAALLAFESALADGNAGAARAARTLLDAGQLGAADERRRLAAAEQQLAKLEEWQRWSGNSVRRRLCADAEALQGSGLHPDALANRVKDLQAEWSRLDAIDGDAAPPADSALARRFRGLCHAALKPARGYFEKRREVRSERAGQIEVLLAEVGAALESAAPGALPPLRRQITDALRELDAVAPEKRGEQGRALRACLARIDAAVAAGREEAALEKRRLIARLRRELGSADAEAGLALAKEAQAQWKRLARGERTHEDALWEELRALIDPLFAGVREREDLRRQQQAEADAAARAVLQELDALASADATRLAHAEAHLEALTARWRALEPADEATAPARDGGARGPGGREQRPRGERGGRSERERRAPRRGHPLEAEFSAALARVQAARQRAAAVRERAAIEAICSAGVLLDHLHSLAHAQEHAALLEAWTALELPAEAREALQPRLAGSAVASAADPETLAVRAELAAGIDSPADAQPVRRQEQMQRLAAKLEGSAQRPPLQEIRSLLIALQAHGGVAPDRRALLQERILRAYDAAAGGSE